jgi:hypothetical protein
VIQLPIRAKEQRVVITTEKKELDQVRFPLAKNIPIKPRTALINAIGQGIGKPSLLIVISPIMGVVSKDQSNSFFRLVRLISFIFHY